MFFRILQVQDLGLWFFLCFQGLTYTIQGFIGFRAQSFLYLGVFMFFRGQCICMTPADFTLSIPGATPLAVLPRRRRTGAHVCASQGFLEFRVLGVGFCCVPMVYGLHIFRNQSLELWVLLGFKIVFRDSRVDFRVYRIQGFLRIRVEGFLGLYVQDLGFPEGFFWVMGFGLRVSSRFLGFSALDFQFKAFQGFIGFLVQGLEFF